VLLDNEFNHIEPPIIAALSTLNNQPSIFLQIDMSRANWTLHAVLNLPLTSVQRRDGSRNNIAIPGIVDDSDKKSRNGQERASPLAWATAAV